VSLQLLAEAVKAEVARSNRLKGKSHGWQPTKNATPAELAELEGGRYEARYGDVWLDHVKIALAKGDHGLICVTELMQHAIDEGDRLFEDTEYADTWWLFHDHLSAWWEKEAQEYLAERGFRDRQLRAWGETNSEFPRYHESLVGNRPEMMPLDFHLFEDLHVHLDRNVILTSSKPKGPPDDPCKFGRYCAGTPTELSHSLELTWAEHPTSERIVEDISRLPLVIDQIIEHRGSLVADATIHRQGCSRTKRTGKRGLDVSDAVAAVAKKRVGELRAKAQSMAGVSG
jgi:hypothetical protein